MRRGRASTPMTAPAHNGVTDQHWLVTLACGINFCPAALPRTVAASCNTHISPPTNLACGVGDNGWPAKASISSTSSMKEKCQCPLGSLSASGTRSSHRSSVSHLNIVGSRSTSILWGGARQWDRRGSAGHPWKLQLVPRVCILESLSGAHWEQQSQLILLRFAHPQHC